MRSLEPHPLPRPPRARLAALALALAASACARPMDQVAGTNPPVDFSDLPGEPDWEHLPDVEEILQHTDYQPPSLPCRACHDQREPDPTPRQLTQMHADIVFNHDEEHRWCFGCHNPDDRSKLRLADGKLIEFTRHPELCGQCHGTIFRDWKVGIHGRRTGSWKTDADARYLACVECHDPHDPRFKPLAPKPPPERPHAGGAAAASNPTRVH